MQSDPQRQWFIYFKEKEIGPISESDVAGRFTAGEIDGTAYVYTEGMPDWILVSELPLFTKTATLQSVKPTGLSSDPMPNFEAEEMTFEPAAPASAPTSVKRSADPTLQQNPVVAATVPPRSTKSEVSRKKFSASTLALALLAICLVGYYFYIQQNPSFPNSKAIPKTQDVISGTQESPLADKQVPPVAPIATMPAAKSSAANSFGWDELLALRNSTDKSSPPFIVSAKHLGDMRPILVGAVSPLLKAEALSLAIFPDNERTLMVLPKVWMLKVPVVDGLFSAGPLNIDGAEIPPGTYHVMARFYSNITTAKSYLGEVTFEAGAWPSSAELSKQQQNILTERASYAQKEKAALDAKLVEVNAAVGELKELGKVAAQGPKALKAWIRVSAPWIQKINSATQQQAAVQRDPAFYGEAQSKLYEFMKLLSKTYTALSLSAREGPKMMTQKTGRGLGQWWAELSTAHQQLVGEVQTLSTTPSMDLKINDELVKHQLLETNL